MNFEPHWKSSSSSWSHIKEAARQNRKSPTRAEALLWERLRGGRLAGLKFRRQHAIGPYIVDFFCSQARLVIEVDGPVHATQADQDQERSNFLRGLGLRVVRFTNEQASGDLRAILADIEGMSKSLSV